MSLQSLKRFVDPKDIASLIVFLARSQPVKPDSVYAALSLLCPASGCASRGVTQDV
jgi:hypothetical protein